MYISRSTENIHRSTSNCSLWDQKVWRRGTIMLGGTSSAKTSFDIPRPIVGGSDAVVSRFPATVWRKILAELSHEDIKSMTLLSSIFRSLCQPLLFRKLVLHPYYTSLADRGFTYLHRRRWIKQSEFFLLPHIAPVIEECYIVPRGIRLGDGGQKWSTMDDIVDSIFNILPNFVNLEKLVCYQVDLTSKRMINGLRVLSLKSIWLDSCYRSGPRISDMVPMPLDTVVLYNSVPPRGSHIDPSFLSRFLHSPHLKKLVAGPTDDILVAMILHPNPFWHLSELDVPIDCIMSNNNFVAALNKCPELTRLSLRPFHKPVPKHGLASFPIHIVPKLQFYKGPHVCLPAFANDRRLKTIDISFACSPEGLKKSLDRVKQPGRDHVESLTVKINCNPLASALLHHIHAAFPCLRVLVIKHAACSALDWSALLKGEEHCCIQTLRFGVNIGDPYLTWNTPLQQIREATKAFVYLYPSLMRTYPSLQRAQIVYNANGVSLVWRNRSPGRSTALDLRDVRVEVDSNKPESIGRSLRPGEMQTSRGQWAVVVDRNMALGLKSTLTHA
ncbi:uncharacterized protein EV420DRAFT_1116230 [Desarmillaria tabescens]|uniref:F-box domain-containing protein n=1 Tax=Armillaria tabescens TaxID=1929756 RepID=A0AA39NE51_ARMTA|nr:uncharacterized protein EV420DRAFT_1116230 [Desarmillaria tabescens]KAK0463941.1 hypothetical protein EV420DRAFT_1116230 [Desarmillaria tabescens]